MTRAGRSPSSSARSPKAKSSPASSGAPSPASSTAHPWRSRCSWRSAARGWCANPARPAASGLVAEDVEPALLSHLDPGRELEPGRARAPAPALSRTPAIRSRSVGWATATAECTRAPAAPSTARGTTCYADYEGTEVTVEATPEAASVFSGFGPPCEGQNPCVVRLDGDVALSARFNPWPLLSVTMSGGGMGRVNATFGALDCPTRCSAPYAPGASVTLNAGPAPGSRFQGWLGACSGTQPSCRCDSTRPRASRRCSSRTEPRRAGRSP